MDESTVRVWTSVAPAVISALVSIAVVVVNLRQTRAVFYSHRLWERKVEAYVDILKNLGVVRHHVYEHLSASETAATLAPSFAADLFARRTRAEAELRTASTLGGVLTTQATSDALSRMLGSIAFDGGLDYHSKLESEITAVDDCIKLVKAEAAWELKR